MPAPAPITHIHPTRPVVDGICADDLYAFPDPAARATLIGRGLVYKTSFFADGYILGGTIVAGSWEQAEEIAFGRGLGETIVGLMMRPTRWLVS